MLKAAEDLVQVQVLPQVHLVVGILGSYIVIRPAEDTVHDYRAFIVVQIMHRAVASPHELPEALLDDLDDDRGLHVELYEQGKDPGHGCQHQKACDGPHNVDHGPHTYAEVEVRHESLCFRRIREEAIDAGDVYEIRDAVIYGEVQVSFAVEVCAHPRRGGVGIIVVAVAEPEGLAVHLDLLDPGDVLVGTGVGKIIGEILLHVYPVVVGIVQGRVPDGVVLPEASLGLLEGETVVDVLHVHQGIGVPGKAHDHGFGTFAASQLGKGIGVLRRYIEIELVVHIVDLAVGGIILGAAAGAGGHKYRCKHYQDQ